MRRGVGGDGWRNQIINVLSVQAYESFSSGGVPSNARQLRGGLQRARLLVSARLHLHLLVTLHSSLGFFYSPLFPDACLTSSLRPSPVFFPLGTSSTAHCVLVFFILNVLVRVGCRQRAAPVLLRPRRCFPLSLPAQPLVLRSGSICFHSLAAEPLPERLKAG